jgi:hypothetical protein
MEGSWLSPVRRTEGGAAFRRYSAGSLACAAALAAVLLGFALTQTARAIEPGIALTKSTTKPYYACPNGPCDAVIDPAPVKTSSGYELPAGGPLLEGSGEKGGFAPTDLRSAYSIPTSGGTGQTVAVIDAYGDKTAEADLALYREKYGIGSCTKSNGCFKKVNESGEEANYPETGETLEEDWELETALDLDMVSAACPNCHIMLVEATTQYASDTGASVNTAASLGATEISNSYGYPENYEAWCGTTGCSQYKSDYNHGGIDIMASSGDSGYRDGGLGVSFPAAAPTVTAVGGTSLHKATNSRGWSEEVWSGTGSGCSEFESKPSWQTDGGCAKRTANDVAAVASCETPVSVYSTPDGGWINVCGTSASSPLVSAIDAHASEHTRSRGAEGFYEDTSALFDVTSGSNGTCSGSYLCTAGTGFDGPTGLGTPDGIPHVVGWSFEPTPLESGATESSMTAVSCTSSTACVGVANYSKPTRAHGAYAEKWNGTGWVIQGLPNPSGATASWIEDVSCSSSTACFAVGSYENSSGTRVTLTERWNGTEWLLQSSPNPSGARESALLGVSCTSTTACTTVGRYVNSSGVKVTLAEAWNGTEWSIKSTPNPTGSTEAVMHKVSCTSSTSCVSSADYVHSGLVSAFVEKWNGTEWAIQSVATPSGAQQVVLLGISCTSSTACTSVGYYENSSSIWVTLAERWNGTEWTVQSTPLEPGATTSALIEVSCTSSTSCVAVAQYGSSARPHASYAERWNGTSWSLESLPSPSGSSASWMYGVSCTSSTACTAAGADTEASGTTVTLGEGYF